MLFYIAPSLVRMLKKDDQETFEFLSRLIDSRQRGLCLIHASAKTYSEVMEYFLKKGRNSEANVLLSISRRARETSGLLRDLSKFIYVSAVANKFKLRVNKIITASPSLINRSNFLYYPIMLGENLTDCHLYVSAIAENYTNGIPVSMANLKISARKQLGGGGTIFTQYKHTRDEGIELCLCVVDSDRRCPDEGLGETAKLVVDVDRVGYSPSCNVIVIDMYSAENLLPVSELNRQFSIGKNADQIEIFKKTLKIRERVSWKYLPLKKGIRGVELKEGKAYSKYWKEEVNDIGFEVPCCDKVECDCVILPAIGSKTLAVAVAAGNDSWYKSLNSEGNPEIAEIYRKLSYELRSWFCVGKEMRS